MKKRIMAVLVLVALALNIAVYADEYDFLEKEYTSAEETMTMEFEIKKPMEFLKYLDPDGVVDRFLDIELFVKSLEDMDMSAKAKVMVNDEKKTAEMSLEAVSSMPLRINRNLKITADQQNGIWMKADYSDEDNFKITYIYQAAFLNKYLVITEKDLFEDDAQKEEFAKYFGSIGQLFSKDKRAETAKKTKDLILKYADVKKSGSSYTFVLSGEKLAGFLKDIFDLLAEIMPDNDEIGEASDMYKNMIDENIAAFNGVSCTLVYDIDNSQNIRSQDMVLEINTNIYDLLSESYDNIKKSDCDIDIAFKSHFEYTKLNEDIKVEFPEINDNNSISFKEFAGDNGINYDPSDDYIYYEDKVFDISGYGINEDDYSLFIPLRELMAGFGVDDAGYSFENGVITFNGGDWFGEASVRPGERRIVVDGKEYETDHAAYIKDGTTYINESAAEYLFGYSCYNSSFDLMTDNSPVSVSFDKIYNDYNDDDDYTKDYYYNVSAYNVKGRGPEKIMMPVRDVLDGFRIADQVEYNNGDLTVFGGKWFGKAEFSIGKKEIAVDGNTFEMDNAAELIDSTTYVDLSFAEKLFGVRTDEARGDIRTGWSDIWFINNREDR